MPLDNKKALLIDDNEITNYYNTDVIDGLKVFDKVVALQSPSDALDYIITALENEEHIPALFIVDVKMPEMDGFEFIDELDELLDEYEVEVAPVFLILTTSNHKRDYEQFEKTPLAQKFLTKPLDEAKLREVLVEFEFIK